MQISVTGKQIDIGDSLKSYVEEKIEATITKYFENPLKATIAFSKEGSMMKCDISTHPTSGVLVQSGGESSDIYGAFDEANARINKQLSKYKERFADHHNVVNERVTMSVFEKTDDNTPMKDEAVVVAEMEYYIPTCSVNVAVMRMDLADANSLLFKNIKNGQINLIYRRRDGNIGWVDPQQVAK